MSSIRNAACAYAPGSAMDDVTWDGDDTPFSCPLPHWKALSSWRWYRQPLVQSVADLAGCWANPVSTIHCGASSRPVDGNRQGHLYLYIRLSPNEGQATVLRLRSRCVAHHRFAGW